MLTAAPFIRSYIFSFSVCKTLTKQKYKNDHIWIKTVSNSRNIVHKTEIYMQYEIYMTHTYVSREKVQNGSTGRLKSIAPIPKRSCHNMTQY